MTGTNNQPRLLFALAVKAFILPMPQYAYSLSGEEYIAWLSRLIWMLMLTVGVGAVLMLVGFLARKLQKKTQKTG